MNKTKKIIVFGFLACLCLMFVLPAEAKQSILDSSKNLSTVAGRTGIEDKNVSDIIGRTIRTILTTVGLVFLVLMVYAGVSWMTARGNEEQATKARKIITGAVLGLIVIVAANAMTTFVTSRVVRGDKTGSGALEGPAVYIEAGTPLGCCLDKVGAGWLAEATAVWACRIDSEENCIKRANTSETGDVVVGEGTYEWINGMEQAACLAECEQRN